MGRPAKLTDHGWKVHGIKECFLKAEAEALRKKYGFRREGFDFHGKLNSALSWHDTYLDLEERPAKESIKILRAVHRAATLLRAYLAKPGADKLLRKHRETPVANPVMRVHYPTDKRVLVALEARCEGWPAPAKQLRQDIRKASERLRDALSKCGQKEVPKLFDYDAFPKPADLPSALDWLISASAAAAKQITDDTGQHQPDAMPRGKRKPTSTHVRQLIIKLWELLRSADPGKGDTIRWDRTNKRYAGTFYEFAREIFLKAGIRISHGHLGNLVKGVEAARAARAAAGAAADAAMAAGALIETVMAAADAAAKTDK